MAIIDFLVVGRTYLFNFGERGSFVAPMSKHFLEHDKTDSFAVIKIERLEDSNNDWVIGKLTCAEGTLEPIPEEHQRTIIQICDPTA